MLSSVTLYCRVTMVAMLWGSQLSEMSKISQLLWDCYLRVFSKCLQNPSLRVFSKCTIQVPKDTIFDKSNTEENWQHSQNNDTLLHSGRPHRWLQVPSVQHSQAHIPTSIEELRIHLIKLLYMSIKAHLGMTEHLHPRRRFHEWESPGSHKSNYHGASCQEGDKSSLNNYCQLRFVENITNYLWGSWTTNICFCDFYFCFCRLGDNSRLHFSRHCTCLCTIWSSFDL